MFLVITVILLAVQFVVARVVLDITPRLIEQTKLKTTVHTRAVMTALFIFCLTAMLSTLYFGVLGMLSGDGLSMHISN